MHTKSKVPSHIASREQDEEPHQTPNLCFRRLEPKRNLLVEPAIGINEVFFFFGGGGHATRQRAQGVVIDEKQLWLSLAVISNMVVHAVQTAD